ncbi:MAG: hypothetical protein JSR54_09225 [Proteobacteria bacterium]|nr:hypothetical protein [Pseudomonadota bacterium]
MSIPHPRSASLRRAASATVTFAALLLALPSAAQRAPAAGTGGCPLSAARVGVSARGAVAVNGTIVPIEHLAESLRALRPRPTEICYFREKPAGAPPASVRTIIDAIASLKWPISFYADAAFTTRATTP